MIINIVVDILLALLIFSMPELVGNAIIRIIAIIILCILFFINNTKLIKKMNTSCGNKKENNTDI